MGRDENVHTAYGNSHSVEASSFDLLEVRERNPAIPMLPKDIASIRSILTQCVFVDYR